MDFIGFALAHLEAAFERACRTVAPRHLRATQHTRWLRPFLLATALASASCVTPTYITRTSFVIKPSSVSVVYTARGLTDGVWLRMRSLDDGRLLGSAWVFFWDRFSHVVCRPSVPGRLWCLENSPDTLSSHGLRVRNDESLQIIAEQDEMMARAPGVGRMQPIDKWLVDPQTHAFRFVTRDGYAWTIDPTTLVPSQPDEPRGSNAKPDESPSSSGCRMQVGGDCYTLRYGLRGKLERNGVVVHPEHTYLDPMHVPMNARPVDGWPHVLITEKVIDHDPTLWCLSLDGTVEWKVTEFPDQRVHSARLYRDTLVLVSYAGLIALRPQDGKVVWKAPP